MSDVGGMTLKLSDVQEMKWSRICRSSTSQSQYFIATCAVMWPEIRWLSFRTNFTAHCTSNFTTIRLCMCMLPILVYPLLGPHSVRNWTAILPSWNHFCKNWYVFLHSHLHHLFSFPGLRYHMSKRSERALFVCLCGEGLEKRLYM